jgi:iron complex outermembrane recepter protein
MKKMFLGICFFSAFSFGQAQQATTIIITDQDGNGISNATIEIEKAGGLLVADDYGKAVFKTRLVGLFTCRISSVGFRTLVTSVTLPATTLHLQLKRDLLFLQPVEVKALRASDRAPFAKANLKKGDIEKQNLGQDLPFILQQTPSLIVSSDAGNGIGYTSLRIRGTDATRINFTINGIPYNDAESQGVFLVNLPDIASSLNSIQVQRGVGTSSNGAGAFGASINLATNEFNEKSYVELNNSIGSYNTRKHTIKGGTGLIKGHFTLDARLSSISSDGFIDRASSKLRSFYASAAYLSKKSSVRMNFLSGKEKTYQAWNGIPEYKLFFDRDKLLEHYRNNIGTYYFTEADSVNLFTAKSRNYNGFTYANQTDNYQQNHYQLFFNHEFSKYWSMNMAAYLTPGKGYYEEFKVDAQLSNYGLPDAVVAGQTIKRTDLVRQLWLDNNLVGAMGSFIYKKDKQQVTFGGGINQYKGDHFGKVVWTAIELAVKEHQWYFFDAVKKDGHAFIKHQYSITKRWQLLTDLQFRKVDYAFSGTRKFPSLLVDNEFNFFNPKLGISYLLKGVNFYASYAIANREPNRNDFETGTAAATPKAEQLFDWEAGAEKNELSYSWGINFYYMKYKNQLVLTGKINDVGDAVRINVPNSYRAGTELLGRVKIGRAVQVSGNLTWSNNTVIDFSDNTPRYDLNFDLVKQDTFFFKRTRLAFSPDIVASGVLQVFPFKQAEINLISKYVSRQYLDNTGNHAKSINPYFVSDLRFQYNIKIKRVPSIVLVAQISNVLNTHYESNGYTYSYFYDQTLVRENFYYPMAGRNVMIAINMKF